MKANELMIGDWVCHKDYPSIPIRVCGNSTKVSFEHSLLWNEDNREYVRIERYSECDYDEITPIHLTPEILEKNGFVEISHRIKRLRWAWKKSGNLIEITEISQNVFRVIHHVDYSDMPDSCILIRHLHQLQHALKLCGIEKEIEL